MSFFHKINVTKCLGRHYDIWTSDSNFLLAQKNFSGLAWPSFQALNTPVRLLTIEKTRKHDTTQNEVL